MTHDSCKKELENKELILKNLEESNGIEDNVIENVRGNETSRKVKTSNNNLKSTNLQNKI